MIPIKSKCVQVGDLGKGTRTDGTSNCPVRSTDTVHIQAWTGEIVCHLPANGVQWRNVRMYWLVDEAQANHNKRKFNFKVALGYLGWALFVSFASWWMQR